ncbi:MAG: cyclic nucleotide-binding domain-containing protein [Spartobacteria bacterium]
MNEADRAALSECGSFESAKPGEKLFHQGKPHGRLILILSGLLQAKAEERGHTEILGKILPGEWLGEVNLFDPSAAACSVEAVEPSEYWVITRDAFEKFINKNHAAGSILLIGLATTLSKRIRSLTEKHVVTAKKTKRPFLRISLALVSIIAIAAIWNWIGGEIRIGSLRTLKQQGMAEVERELEDSKVKTKELELEVARLEEELEWAKSESEKKTAKTLTPTAPKTEADAAPVEKPQAQVGSTETATEVSEPSQSVTAEPKPKPRPGVLPPEIVLTKETMVPLTVNGKVSGSAKIAPGKTFKVVGVEGDDVLVTMAGSTVRIPVENSNFDEAVELAASHAEEKAKAAKPVVASTPTPTPVPTPAAKPEVHREAAEAQATETPLVQVEKMMSTLNPLKAIDALRDFRKPGKEGARTAFLRSEGRKWEQAAESAKNALRSQSPDDATKRLLKNIVLTAEMFQTERFEGIEGKLHEIDAGWLALKTDLEIYGPEGAPKPAAPEL